MSGQYMHECMTYENILSSFLHGTTLLRLYLRRKAIFSIVSKFIGNMLLGKMVKKYKKKINLIFHVVL